MLLDGTESIREILKNHGWLWEPLLHCHAVERGIFHFETCPPHPNFQKKMLEVSGRVVSATVQIVNENPKRAKRVAKTKLNRNS